MENQFEVIQSDRKKTIRKRIRNIFLCFLAFFLLTVYIVLTQFKIEKIQVVGNSHYTKKQITDIVKKDHYIDSTVLLYLKNKVFSQKEIPFVDSYDIDFKSRNAICITVYEKAIAGCIEYMGAYIYFDKDGIVLETSDKKIEEVPIVLGLNFESIVLHEKLPAKDDKKFEIVLDLTQQIKKNEVKIDKIRYGVDGNLTLYYHDVKVLLGKGKDIDEKVMELANILKTEEIQNMSGTLHLEEYSSNSKTVTFKKQEK